MSRAWVDEADEGIEESTPAFLKGSHNKPSWAKVEASTESETADEQGTTSSSMAQKRQRNEELEEALASTAPLLDSKHQRTTNTKPAQISVFPMPRDMCRSIHWHPNGQLCTAAGNHHVYLFHASGKYVETLGKIDTKVKIDSMTLAPTGEDAVVTPQQSYVPQLVHFETEAVTPLTFLDTRENFAYRHDHRNDTHSRAYNFISHPIVFREQDAATQMMAVANHNAVTIGSLASASVIQRIHTSDPVLAMQFSGRNELTLLVQNRVLVYDIRKTAKVVREFVDEGSIGGTALARSSEYLAVASKSGIVNMYASGSTVPMKTLKNLATDVTCLSFGKDKHGEPVAAMLTPDMKSGARIVKLPSCQVVAGFPSVGARHGFLHAAAFAPGTPVLSIGERGRISNYVV